MLVSNCIPFVLNESHTLNVLQSRTHGLDHWFRVWHNAKLLIKDEPTASLEVAALYALFHDSMRVNDGDDPQHGYRGYKLWEKCFLQQDLSRFLTHRECEQLFEACTEHNTGKRSTDPTIAVCWDADRLDLPRKGIWPDARFMSTNAAISLTMNRITS